MPVCSGVKFAPAPERRVAQPTVNVPTRMPSYRLFNVLYFIPSTEPGNRVFLDDVTVKWTPTLHYAAPGPTVALRETFEQHAVGSLDGSAHEIPWRIEPAGAGGRFAIERTTSYGTGVKCLRASGGSALVGGIGNPTDGRSSPRITAPRKITAPRRTTAPRRITIDLDVFVRSDKDFPYILPDPTTRSRHGTAISIEAAAAAGKPLAAVNTGGGTWQLWDGTRFADSGTPVTYDVWNHVQIAVDAATGRYTLVVQPVGELPTRVGDAAWGQAPGGRNSDVLTWKISPSDTEGHTSCYDNIIVTVDAGDAPSQ